MKHWCLLALLVFTIAASVNAGLNQVHMVPLNPRGLRIEFDDAGYDMVALHFSVNKQLHGVAAGDINVDITVKSGNKWVYEYSRPVQPGDTVNYWALAFANGAAVDSVTDQSYVIPVLTTPALTTTTTTPTSTTAMPTTPAPGGATSGTAAASIALNTNSATTTSSTGVNVVQPAGTVAGTGQGGSCACSQSGSKKINRVCNSYPCLIFEDNFDDLDVDIWEHEITAGGGGNWEFQYYTNNRTNSYVKNGTLFIKPTLTTEKLGPQSLTSGTLDLWGSSPGDLCTGNAFYGCERHGTPSNLLNPIQSARLRSSRGFSFKYGKLEVEAKMPTGDWIWPAIWLLPKWNAYGQWPASGEIDLVEARGNRNYHDAQGKSFGVDQMGSTLHFGTDFQHDPYQAAHVEKAAKSGTFGDSFHKYGLEWDENAIKFYLDDELILNVAPGPGGFWDLGNLGQLNFNNPWQGRPKMAPFDQEFFIILNVAVGGTAFFPDAFRNTPHPKPWRDASQTAMREFWNAKNQWYPTWNADTNNGEDAAMQVKYIRVWKLKP
ncbi:hypothetical protein ScPMuIL_007590 [Solemya velum]